MNNIERIMYFLILIVVISASYFSIEQTKKEINTLKEPKEEIKITCISNFKDDNVTKTEIPPSTIVSSTPSPTPVPTIISSAPSQYLISKTWNPDLMKADYEIKIEEWSSRPPSISIETNKIVLVRISELFPNTYALVGIQSNLGTENFQVHAMGVLSIKFNKKGIYVIKTYSQSEDKSIAPNLYATTTVSVY